MYSIEVTYTEQNNEDTVDLSLSEKELSSFLNMLKTKYPKLYTVECSKHTVFGFGTSERKVVVKVDH